MHKDYLVSLKPKKVPLVRTKFRIIRTKIPAPHYMRVFKELSKYESRAIHGQLGQLPVAWDRAKDFQVFDKDSNCWIDFTSTIFVTNVGHANPRIIKAIRRQLDKPLLHAFSYPTEIRARFLKKLIGMTPKFCQKALMFSSGTEAAECVIPIMRMYGRKTNKSKIALVSFTGSMHGITMGAEMLRGNPEALALYGYSDPNIYHLPFPYPWEGSKNYDWSKRFANDVNVLRKGGLDFKNIAGFVIESYRGWGAIFYPKEYIRALVRFARKYKALVAFDDIQGGFGRTGKMFAYEHYGVEPDLIFMGKGMSSSLPLSAIAGRSWVMDLPETGGMHSTHSANPMSCAAALANLEELESKNLIKEAARKGKILLFGLNALKKKFPQRISFVSGRGLIAAILFKNPKTGKPESEFPSRVCERAMQKGLLLVHTNRESVKIAPPLTIPDGALKEGIRVLEESIKEIDLETAQIRC